MSVRPSAAVGVIPARLASTRFPRKILASETGMTLIEHVWRSARRSAALSSVVLAVDDPAVFRIAREFGAEAVMTRVDHPNGTSRLAEAAALLGLPDEALVVNVQGDEPDLDPGVIDAAVELAGSSGAEVTTVASKFGPDEDPADPNIVKVVMRSDARAMYFSRSPIPFHRDRTAGAPPASPLKHIGLYVYRVGFLRRYVDLAPTPLEQTEMLEQLRVLEHGYAIAVAVRQVSSQGIDTAEQYAAFVARWRATHQR